MYKSDTRVLVVDDAQIMRTTLVNMLQVFGFADVIEAADGNEAWDRLQASEKEVGLVLVDLNMPNCNGVEFVKRARADQRYKNLPIILVTAENEKNLVLDAIKAGISAYIHKPVTNEELMKKLVFCFTKMTKAEK